MNSSELLESFCQNYQQWLKLSTGNGIQYQRKLSAKQTKYFLDLYCREHRMPGNETEVNGFLIFSSGTRIAYQIKRIRHGAGLLTVEEMQP